MQRGVGVDALHYLNNPPYRDVIRNNFQFLIPIWGMMPKSHYTTQDFEVDPFLDKAVNLALKDGLKIHGHCLLTRFDIPAWIEPLNLSQEEAAALLHAQVTTIVSYWGERVSDWVVINEMLGSSGVTPAHPFTAILGERALEIAFKAAAAANPKCKLWLSEFGIQNPILWSKVYEIVHRLLRANTPIHGVSAHLHVNLFPQRNRHRIANFAAHLYPYHGIRINLLKFQVAQFKALGLDFHGSELTIWPSGLDGLKLKAQAAAYNRYFKACSDAKCDKISVWSLVDDPRHTELSWRWDKQKDYPGLFAWDDDSQSYLPKFEIL